MQSISMVATPCFQKGEHAHPFRGQIKIKEVESALKVLSTLPAKTCHPPCSCACAVCNKYCVHFEWVVLSSVPLISDTVVGAVDTCTESKQKRLCRKRKREKVQVKDLCWNFYSSRPLASTDTGVIWLVYFGRRRKREWLVIIGPTSQS